jgi:hypothetical protein
MTSRRRPRWQARHRSPALAHLVTIGCRIGSITAFLHTGSR